jgi:hypothetical protein
VRFYSLGGKIARFFHKIRYGKCRAKKRRFFFRRNRALGWNCALPAMSALDKAARAQKMDIVWFPTPSAQLT